MKTIGIIGGMGPEATVDLYSKITKLTPAKKDQDHLHVIIDSYAQIPDRTAYILGHGDDPTRYLIESAKRLEQAGAEVLCMPCNTAHYFLPTIANQVSIPFISIVDSTIQTLQVLPDQPKKIFVMATTGTRAAKVYETKLVDNGFEVIPLPDDIQTDLMGCIYDGVKQGKTREFIPLFESVVQRLEALQPDAIIAACTEIPLLTAYIKTKTPIVDATLELAKACVEFSVDKKV